MKLWLLTPVDENSAPWSPWDDKAFGFVVRAETEDAARILADAAGADENREVKYVQPWLMPQYSMCVPLLEEGVPGIVIQDFHAA